MKRHYKIYRLDKPSDANDKPSDTNDKPIDTIRYKDKRVISNGYFSIFRNQFISFSERKRANKINYDDGEYF